MIKYSLVTFFTIMFFGFSFGQKNDTIPSITIYKGIVDGKKYQAILTNYRNAEFSDYTYLLRVFNENESPKECAFYKQENHKETKCYINLSGIEDYKTAFIIEKGVLKYQANNQKIQFIEDPDWNYFYAVDDTHITSVEVTYDDVTKNTSNDSYHFNTIWKNHPKLEKLKFLTKKFPKEIENKAFYKKEKIKSTNEEDIYNYYDMDWTIPFYFDNNVIVFSKGSDVYLGGTHGLPTVDYITYSLKTGNKININDFIDIQKNQHQIEDLLQKSAKEYIANSDMYLDSDIPISESYYFSPRGITFSYNPYEIAGFAVGIIELFIPYSEIKNYNPNSEIAQFYLRK